MPVVDSILFAFVERTVSEALEHRATIGAARLHDNLGQPGSGVKYPTLPNVSSAKGEFPAEQSGDLRGSVDAWPIAWHSYAMGLRDAPEHAIYLEYLPPSMGGRNFMWRTFNDPATWKEMNRG